METPESKAAPCTEAATLDAKQTGTASLSVSLVLTLTWFACNKKRLILHCISLGWHTEFLQQSLCARAASQKSFPMVDPYLNPRHSVPFFLHVERWSYTKQVGKQSEVLCLVQCMGKWGSTQDSPCRGYSWEHLCSQGHPLELFTSAGRHGWKTKIELYLQWQKAGKVAVCSVVTHRLKNEAEGLISLDTHIRYIFLGLGCGILTKAFLIVQLQLKVTQVNNYSYLSLKIRAYMKKEE